MAPRQEHLEALESCRPGHDDLARPEMEALRAQLQQDPQLRATFERTQQSDAAIGRAMREVPVPEGLEARLLEALAAARQPAPAELAARDVTAAAVSVTRRSTERGSRRGWLAASLAAAAALLLAAWLAWPQPTATPQQLALQAQAWTESLPAEAGEWQAFDEQRFPTLAWRSARWRTMRTKLDPRAVVFDFPRRGDERLVVYRLHTTRDLGLPSLPYQPLTTTGKWRVGAWQESEYVFVAVTNRPALLDGFRARLAPT